MSNDTPGLHHTPIVINISPEILLNKHKKTVKDTCSAVCALLNSHHGGMLQLTSSKSLTPPMIDRFVRGIEQTLIELLGLTGLRKYCKTEITGPQEIVFRVKPSDRVYTVEYNLVSPTNFLVQKVHKMEPLETIARVLQPGRPLVNIHLRNHVLEFVKESPVPQDLRESDTVQFKKVKSDKNKNKSLADRIIANKIAHYIAAFANHKGGHVYIGIDDETYKVCGQIIDEEERQRIVEKIGSAIAKMIWPEEHGKPERGKHWDISFVPVLDANKEAISGLFVIVAAIACCPGGVFLSYPEAYEINDGEVVPMEFKRWKKRVLHDAVVPMEFKRWKKRVLQDAQMRDIVKFSRENSRKKSDSCQLAKSQQSDSGSPKLDCTMIVVCDLKHCSIPFPIPKISPGNGKCRNIYRLLTVRMQHFIINGEFQKLRTFASIMFKNSKVITRPGIKVAIGFVLALKVLCLSYTGTLVKAYKKLDKASSLIAFTEDPELYELEKLHLLACIRKGEGEYDKSYEVTYAGLQKIEGISPGWHTARALYAAGHLFGILAAKERNREVRKSLEQQAVSMYRRAIDHTSATEKQPYEFDQILVQMSNLLHRCHLRLAMLSLGCNLFVEEDDDCKVVTNDEMAVAISSILVVEENTLKGDSLNFFNMCLLYLVKSDLNYRKSQFRCYQAKYIKTAKFWAKKARNLAIESGLPVIIKPAISRIDRLKKVHSAA